MIVMLTNQIYRDQNGNRVFGIANSASPTSTNKFCIVEAGFLLDPRYTFAHEVAHQFGCRHIDDNTGDVCAHAHVLALPGGLNRPTILGPSNATAFGAANARIQHYSNPDVFFAGVSTGVSGQRDNAREIRAAMCDVANNQPPPVLVINIDGLVNLCSPVSGEILNATYSVDLTPPVAGFPGQPPYTIQWYWSPDGIFSPGTFLGTGASVTVGAFACPGFHLRAKVTSADGQIYTRTRRINTAFCNPCTADRSSGIQTAETADNLDGVSIFPNPTDGVLWIDFSNDVVPQQIGLFDLGGKKVQEIRTSARPEGSYRLKMDIMGLAPGVYALRIQSAGRTIVRKVILQPTK